MHLTVEAYKALNVFSLNSASVYLYNRYLKQVMHQGKYIIYFHVKPLNSINANSSFVDYKASILYSYFIHLTSVL